MSFVEIGQMKAQAKARSGLKPYQAVFEKYLKYMLENKVNTKVAQLEDDTSKHKHIKVVSNTGTTLYIAEIPAVFKDGTKGTKQLLKRACNPATNECAYLKSYYAPKIEA